MNGEARSENRGMTDTDGSLKKVLIEAKNLGLNIGITAAGEKKFIYSPLNPTPCLYAVLSGQVGVFLRSGHHGLSCCSRIVKPDMLFGLEHITNDNDRLLSAKPLAGPAKVARFTPKQFKKLFDRSTAFNMLALESFADALMQTYDFTEMLAFENLPKQVLQILERLSNGSGAVKMAHQGLADMLATYRETVSAILRGLKSKGVVRGQNYRRIELDRNRLAEELAL